MDAINRKARLTAREPVLLRWLRSVMPLAMAHRRHPASCIVMLDKKDHGDPGTVRLSAGEARLSFRAAFVAAETVLNLHGVELAWRPV